MSALCGNIDHHEGYDGVVPPATWSVFYPDGSFIPTTACDRCLTNVILADLCYDERFAITLTPIPPSPEGAVEGGDGG